MINLESNIGNKIYLTYQFFFQKTNLAKETFYTRSNKTVNTILICLFKQTNNDFFIAVISELYYTITSLLYFIIFVLIPIVFCSDTLIQKNKQFATIDFIGQNKKCQSDLFIISST